MSTNDYNHYSAEMLEYRRRPVFFQELTALFDSVKGQDRAGLFQSKLAQQLEGVIKHHMRANGAQVSIGTEDNPRQDYTDISVVFNLPALVKIKDLDIGFDERTGHFFGDTKSLWFRVQVPVSYVTSGKFESDELAALVLHELGHPAFNVKWGARQLRSNIALEQAASELGEGSSVDERISVYRRAIDTAAIPGLNAKDFAQVSDPKVAAVMFANAIANDFKSELGTDAYDRTMEEYYADMFATLNGAGAALTRALGKLESSVLWQARQALRVLGVTGALITAATVGLGVMTGVSAAILGVGWVSALVAGATPMGHELSYDDLHTRIKRIRNQAAKVLQGTTLNREETTQALEALKLIDEQLKQFTTYQDPMSNWLTRVLSSSVRSRLSAQQVQSQYEQLASNDLFTKAAQLRQAL